MVQDSSINIIFCRTLVGITDSLRYVITIMNQSKNYLQIPNTAVLNQTHPHPCQMEQTTSWSIASIWLLMKMQLEPLQSRWLNMLNIDVWVSVRAPFCKWGVPSHLLSPGYLELAPPWDCGSPTLRRSDVIFFLGGTSRWDNHRPNRHEQQKWNMFEYVWNHNCTYTKLSYKSAQVCQNFAIHICSNYGDAFLPSKWFFLRFLCFSPGKKRRQQSLKALPSPWNGAASSGAWIGAHTRHAAVPLHAGHWLGPVDPLHPAQHHIVQFSKIQDKI